MLAVEARIRAQTSKLVLGFSCWAPWSLAQPVKGWEDSCKIWIWIWTFLNSEVLSPGGLLWPFTCNISSHDTRSEEPAGPHLKSVGPSENHRIGRVFEAPSTHFIYYSGSQQLWDATVLSPHLGECGAQWLWSSSYRGLWGAPMAGSPAAEGLLLFAGAVRAQD